MDNSELKNSFILYTNYYEILKDLPSEDAGDIFKAILEYQATGNIPELGFHNSAIFKFIKNQLDMDAQKYIEKVEKNRQNGSLGGAPKGNKNAQKQPKTTQNNPKQPKTTIMINDNDNDNDNDNVLLNTHTNNSESEKKESVCEKKDLSKNFLDNDRLFYNPNNVVNPHHQQYFDCYSEICKDLPPLRYEKRNKQILQILNEFIQEIDNDVGYFREVCKKANEQKLIVNTKIDFKTLLKNHSKIFNECCLNAEQQKQKEVQDNQAKIVAIVQKWEQEDREKSKNQCT